jgi:multiple sugar transport system substrate-binding protein
MCRWLIVALSLLILSGCQLQGDSLPNDVIQLTLWHGVNPPHNRDVLQELVEQFNRQHPQIQVNSLYVGQEDQQTPKILASVVGNVPPDLLWFNPTITGQLVALDAIRPLDDWLATSAIADAIDPALFESMRFQGHTWSVPFGTNNAGIFYRPSLFAAAGITQRPRTWQEFREVAKTLTRDFNGDGRVDQHGILLPLGKGEWTVFMWLPFMWSGGGELVTTGEGHPNSLLSPTAEAKAGVNLVNDGAIAALQFWQNLIEDGSAVLSLPERGYEMDGFLSGQVAMQLSGPWTLGQLRTAGVDFGVIPFPSQVRPATVIGGENLFLFKTNPEREKAAFTFAEYVMGEEFQTQWAMKTGYLPINLQARQSEAYQAFVEEQPSVQVFLEQAAFGRARPMIQGYARISENLGRAIEAVLLGKRSPKDALVQAQKRVELVLR